MSKQQYKEKTIYDGPKMNIVVSLQFFFFCKDIHLMFIYNVHFDSGAHNLEI